MSVTITPEPWPLSVDSRRLSDAAGPYGLFVLTLAIDAIAAITSFSDTGVFRHFGLPPTVPSL